VNELYWLVMLIVNFAGILAAYRLLGKTGLYVWVALAAIIANIQVVKTVEIFGLQATLGNIVYAGSFLATDILSENHGKRDAGRAVGIGFFTLVVMTVLMNLALLFEPSAEDFSHEALTVIFSIMPRIAAASLCAYLVSQIHDIWAYNLWKRKLPTRRFLWIRNNASTLVSQLIDTAVFTVIAFAGVFSTGTVVQIGITTYVLKVLVAAADTPFLYLASRWFERGSIPEGR
jgi:queuosine precursor transporter